MIDQVVVDAANSALSKTGIGFIAEDVSGGQGWVATTGRLIECSRILDKHGIPHVFDSFLGKLFLIESSEAI